MIPLATCFDYAAKPEAYEPEASWRAAVKNIFGAAALPQWTALREFCEAQQRSKNTQLPLRADAAQQRRWREALDYLGQQRRQKWAREFRPWQQMMAKLVL